MIYNSLTRKVLLLATSAIFLVNAGYTLLATEKWASLLGFSLQYPNGHSEIFAVYFGIWLATALLCLLAAKRIQEPIFGDLVAMFLLAQPVGRLVASIQFGFPQGVHIGFFVLELLGGLAVLAVRPAKN